MNTEQKIANAIGEYEGRMEIIRQASDFMFSHIYCDQEGMVDADALDELNGWVERMKANAMKRMVQLIKEA